MGKVEDEEYQSWLKDLADEKFEDPEEQKALEVLRKSEKFGRRVAKGVVGSKELYRRMNAMNEEKLGLQNDRLALKESQEKLKKWKVDADETLRTTATERDELKRKFERQEKLYRSMDMDEEADEVRDRIKDVDDNLSRKELVELKEKLKAFEKKTEERNEKIAQLLQDVPSFTANAIKLSKKYAKDGFDVDEDKAIDLALTNGGDLAKAFDDLVKDQREKRAEQDLEKKIQSAIEKDRQERATQGSAPEGYGGNAPSIFRPFERDARKSLLEEARAANKADMQKFAAGIGK